MLFDVETVAAFAAGTDVRAVPAAVRERVILLVMDTLAACAFGSRRPELAVLTVETRPLTGNGPATVVGSAAGWPTSTAAYLNGCAAAADQLQDGHRLGRGHPASHVVPAVLALAEATDAVSSELLSAVLAGYEVGVRLGRTMDGTPPGVHDIGTWGQVAASAGVARLLAPNDATAMRRAIELSASAVLLTDARTVFAGATGGHAFLGASVQQGLATGVAAVAGLSAEPGSVERHFLAVASQDPRSVVDGPEFEILGGYIKAHPTCAHLHGVNDAVEDLIKDGLRARDVVHVLVEAFAGAASFEAIARSELAARFSVPTSVAVALVDGGLTESGLTDAHVNSAAVLDLARRVHTRHAPDLDSGYPQGRPARVTVTLVDGTQRVAATGRPRWDADRHPGPGQVEAKATRLLTHRFGLDAGPAVFDALRSLSVPEEPVHTLTRALRQAADRTANAGDGVPLQ